MPLSNYSNEHCKNLPYTLAFRVPVCFRSFLSSCQQKLKSVCNSFEAPETAHLTVKFLGFSSDFLDDARIIELLPIIHRIALKYLPLKIYVRGFDTFSYAEGKSTVIFLKVLPSAQLNAFHHEICSSFAEFEIFPHADRDNFQPHITLSKDLKHNHTEQMQRIILRSRKMAKRHLKISDLVVMTPNRMFPVQAEISEPMICPPTR
ncbi:MAG: 2'-5' RNA ligase family protein [Erysipelotrichia bacterium]|nr:2'-5' RNA ligase family protein [Erysipelotrichia bacterium]